MLAERTFWEKATQGDRGEGERGWMGACDADVPESPLWPVTVTGERDGSVSLGPRTPGVIVASGYGYEGPDGVGAIPIGALGP